MMGLIKITMVVFGLLGVGIMSGCPRGGGADGGSTDLNRAWDLALDLGSAPANLGSADLSSRRNSGDCDNNRDCPSGSCIELSPGGYRVCAASVIPATTCSASPEFDQCCKTADCPSATDSCQEWPLMPYCGGAAPIPHNVCASDACKVNADCSGLAVCVPAGVFGDKVRQCLTVGCLRDSDCTAESGGSCVPIKDPCCGAIRGLFCVYPSSCRTNADCPKGYCEPSGARTQCKTGAPPCPP